MLNPVVPSASAREWSPDITQAVSGRAEGRERRYHLRGGCLAGRPVAPSVPETPPAARTRALKTEGSRRCVSGSIQRAPAALARSARTARVGGVGGRARERRGAAAPSGEGWYAARVRFTSSEPWGGRRAGGRLWLAARMRAPVDGSASRRRTRREPLSAAPHPHSSGLFSHSRHAVDPRRRRRRPWPTRWRRTRRPPPRPSGSRARCSSGRRSSPTRRRPRTQLVDCGGGSASAG